MDDRVIDVFVKEFGSELYSVESHPNRGDTVSETMDDTASMKLAEGREKDGEEHGNCVTGERDDGFQEVEGGYGFVGLDPATHEAQIIFGLSVGSPKRFENGSGLGDNVLVGPMDSTDSISDESYPYPPGFGLDLVLAHSHNDLGRVMHYPQIDETATENERASGDYRALRELPEIGESSKIRETTVDKEEKSDETLYKINKEAFRCGFGDDGNEVVRETTVTSEWRENSTKLGQMSVAVVANGDHRGPLNAGIGPTDQPIVSKAVAGNPQEDERAKSPLIEVWDEAGNELSDGEDSAEVNVAREL
ncbi:hypothetical protein PIB30_024432 [Stylosanthes scabra]|uniref:Uncharacterized protein n=1 Tax=Stylosanthes scabra TaxID=79078 RepID=A0ABU6VBG8_9FABA|nr:hypothetical protein [Stylosanthes scabra]